MPVQLLEIILQIANPLCIIPILSIGYWYFDRAIFARIILLIFFTLILNPLLKWLYAIDPMPLHQGYRFPSGHMQFLCVIFFMVIANYKNTLTQVGLSLLLLFYGIGLIWFKHHVLIDIIGGACFAFLTIGLFYAIESMGKIRKSLEGLLLNLLFLACLYLHTNAVWAAYISLVYTLLILQFEPVKQLSFFAAIIGGFLSVSIIGMLLMVFDNPTFSIFSLSIFYMAPITWVIFWPYVINSFRSTLYAKAG